MQTFYVINEETNPILSAIMTDHQIAMAGIMADINGPLPSDLPQDMNIIAALTRFGVPGQKDRNTFIVEKTKDKTFTPTTTLGEVDAAYQKYCLEQWPLDIDASYEVQRKAWKFFREVTEKHFKTDGLPTQVRDSLFVAAFNILLEYQTDSSNTPPALFLMAYSQAALPLQVSIQVSQELAAAQLAAQAAQTATEVAEVKESASKKKSKKAKIAKKVKKSTKTKPAKRKRAKA